MEPLNEGIRRSIHEARIDSLHESMLAASYAAERRRAMRLKLGRRLIAAGERLACPTEALTPRALH